MKQASKIALLAVLCLDEYYCYRPSMKQVAETLERIEAGLIVRILACKPDKIKDK
jgi:hypothetical protein